MGDIADMMLDGTLCEGCGDFLGEGDGYTRLCSACAPHEQKLYPPLKHGKAVCPECGKRVKAAGLEMHIKAKHAA